MANDNFPADFIRENLLIQTLVIDSAYRNNVTKLEFLGSSCVYPKLCCRSLFTRTHCLRNAIDPTNEAYGVAKIAGLKMAQAYRRQYGLNAISLMPTQSLRAGGQFRSEYSHVVPALIRKFVEAKDRGQDAVVVWGDGTATREFLYVEDAAEGIVKATADYDKPDPVNLAREQRFRSGSWRRRSLAWSDLTEALYGMRADPMGNLGVVWICRGRSGSLDFVPRLNRRRAETNLFIGIRCALPRFRIAPLPLKQDLDRNDGSEVVVEGF